MTEVLLAVGRPELPQLDYPRGPLVLLEWNRPIVDKSLRDFDLPR